MLGDPVVFKAVVRNLRLFWEDQIPKSCLWTIEEVGGKPRLHFAFCWFYSMLCLYHLFSSVYTSFPYFLIYFYIVIITYLFLYFYYLSVSVSLSCCLISYISLPDFLICFLYRYQTFFYISISLLYFLMCSCIVIIFSYLVFSHRRIFLSFLQLQQHFYIILI